MAVTLTLSVRVTSSSVANPSVITAPLHGFGSGDSVTISGHTGSTPAVNGTYTITVLDDNTFSIPLNVTVAGTGGRATGLRKMAAGSLNIEATANGIDTCQFTVLSIHGQFRVQKGATCLLADGATRIFGGTAQGIKESWLGSKDWSGIAQRVSASDFTLRTLERKVRRTIPAGTVKAQLTDLLANELAGVGYTLHGSQADGTDNGAIAGENRLVKEVLDSICSPARFVWDVSYTKVLHAFAPGDEAADYDIIDGDGHAIGDLTVETIPSDAYANRMTGTFGSGTALQAQRFVADGVATQWTTDLEAVLTYWPSEITLHEVTIVSSSVANPTVITATGHGLASDSTAIIRGHTGSTPDLNARYAAFTVTVLDADTFNVPVDVTVGGTGGTVALIVPIGPYKPLLGAASFYALQWDPATHTIYQRPGDPVFPSGYTLEITYNAQYPFTIVLNDTDAQDDNDGVVVDGDVSDATVFDYATGLAITQAALDDAVITLQRIEFETYEGPLFPGQTQTITKAFRALDTTCLVTDVMTSDAGRKDGAVKRTVTALGSLAFRQGYRKVYRDWLDVGGGGATTDASIPGDPDGSVQTNITGAFGSSALFTNRSSFGARALLTIEAESDAPWALVLRRTDLGPDADISLFNKEGQFAVQGLEPGELSWTNATGLLRTRLEQLDPTDFADLPTPVQGMIASISDSDTTDVGDPIAGGGSDNVLAYYDGADWIVVGGTGGGGGGSGDVVGPGSAVADHLAVFDGTSGKLIKDGGAAPSGTNTGDVSLAGTPNYLTLAGQVLTRALIDLTSHVTGDLPFANLTQCAALSVLGVTGNATADVAAIAAGSDKQVLRRAGTALTFGAVDLAASAAVTGILPIANLATGTPDGTKFVRDDGTLATPSGTGAPSTATYLTQTADAGLSAEQALSSLATGVMKVTTTTGVVSSIALAGNAGKFLNEAGSFTIPAGGATTSAAPIVVSVDTVLATGTGWVIPESLEVAAGVILEIEGGARLEITGAVLPLEQRVYKATIQSVVSNNITLIDDVDLHFTVGANQIWQFEGIMFVDAGGSGTPDILTSIVGPTGTTGQWGVISNITSVTTTPSGGPGGRAAWDGSATISSGCYSAAGTGFAPIYLYGLAFIGVTAGTIKVQWCQNSSNSTATNVQPGSYLIARRVR